MSNTRLSYHTTPQTAIIGGPDVQFTSIAVGAQHSVVYVCRRNRELELNVTDLTLSEKSFQKLLDDPTFISQTRRKEFIQLECHADWAMKEDIRMAIVKRNISSIDILRLMEKMFNVVRPVYVKFVEDITGDEEGGSKTRDFLLANFGRPELQRFLADPPYVRVQLNCMMFNLLLSTNAHASGRY